MLGTRGCRLGLQWPGIYEMQIRAIVRAALAVEGRTGLAPEVEIMHPLVAFEEELVRLWEITTRTVAEEGPIDYRCGTMIELPRAALRAGELARHADFFSFGTNDLTQTTLGFSRDDAQGRFLTHYLEHGILDRGSVRDARRRRGGGADPDRRRAGTGREPVAAARHLRRAWRRPGVDRLLRRARARLRLLLAVPRAGRTARSRPGSARPHQPRLRACRWVEGRSDSRASTDAAGPCRRQARGESTERSCHVCPRCDQRLRPRRAVRVPLGVRVRRRRSTGSASTTSPTSPPWRTCCATTRSTARSPAPSRSRGQRSSSTASRSPSTRSAIRRDLPWAVAGVDVALECTGRFRSRADAARHLAAGARKVIISAPGKDVDVTLVRGVNEDDV